MLKRFSTIWRNSTVHAASASWHFGATGGVKALTPATGQVGTDGLERLKTCSDSRLIGLIDHFAAAVIDLLFCKRAVQSAVFHLAATGVNPLSRERAHQAGF